MTRGGALLVCVTLGLAACATPPPKKPVPFAPSEQIVLLPHADGTPSSIVVETGSAEVVLSTPYSSVEVASDGLKPLPADEASVKARYATEIQALPRRPTHFFVYFELNSTRLTRASQPVLAEIQKQVALFPAPEVIAIGHADAIGAERNNMHLSYRRAQVVREALVRAGIIAERIQAVGRGTEEPLVPTPNHVPEPRNRVVEIRIR